MIIKQRYNVMLNPNIVSIIDFQANQLCVSRSDLISNILYSYVVVNGLYSEFSDSDMECISCDDLLY